MCIISWRQLDSQRHLFVANKYNESLGDWHEYYSRINLSKYERKTYVLKWDQQLGLINRAHME